MKAAENEQIGRQDDVVGRTGGEEAACLALTTRTSVLLDPAPDIFQEQPAQTLLICRPVVVNDAREIREARGRITGEAARIDPVASSSPPERLEECRGIHSPRPEGSAETRRQRIGDHEAPGVEVARVVDDRAARGQRLQQPERGETDVPARADQGGGLLQGNIVEPAMEPGKDGAILHGERHAAPGLDVVSDGVQRP